MKKIVYKKPNVWTVLILSPLKCLLWHSSQWTFRKPSVIPRPVSSVVNDGHCRQKGTKCHVSIWSWLATLHTTLLRASPGIIFNPNNHLRLTGVGRVFTLSVHPSTPIVRWISPRCTAIHHPGAWREPSRREWRRGVPMTSGEVLGFPPGTCPVWRPNVRDEGPGPGPRGRVVNLPHGPWRANELAAILRAISLTAII